MTWNKEIFACILRDRNNNNRPKFVFFLVCVCFLFTSFTHSERAAKTTSRKNKKQQEVVLTSSRRTSPNISAWSFHLLHSRTSQPPRRSGRTRSYSSCIGVRFSIGRNNTRQPILMILRWSVSRGGGIGRMKEERMKNVLFSHSILCSGSTKKN